MQSIWGNISSLTGNVQDFFLLIFTPSLYSFSAPCSAFSCLSLSKWGCPGALLIVLCSSAIIHFAYFLIQLLSISTCCLYAHWSTSELFPSIHLRAWVCLPGYFATAEIIYSQKLNPDTSLIFPSSPLLSVTFVCHTLTLLLRSAAWDDSFQSLAQKRRNSFPSHGLLIHLGQRNVRSIFYLLYTSLFSLPISLTNSCNYSSHFTSWSPIFS